MDTNKVWYITGASKGLGLALVKQLLKKGYKVAATSRDASAFGDLAAGERFLPLSVNLKDDGAVAASLRSTVAHFGSVDVVVNNAGYGLGGALEELTADEINENFEVNFFAVVRVIQQVLPYLRQQRSGHIINISSIAGFAPGLGWSVYCAAKFAVSGLSAALVNDLKPLGINVTNVMPGAFRTNFAKPDSLAFNQHQIADYDHLRSSHDKLKGMDGAQLGDPEKVADTFIELVNSKTPATDLFLGSDAFDRAQARINDLQQQMEHWKAISLSTDHIA